jgi:hypothetical protein
MADVSQRSPEDADRPGALRGLIAEAGVPPGLEARVEESLRTRGLLDARRPRTLSVPLAVAASLLCLVGGLLIGARIGGEPSRAAHGDAPRFALLLYGGGSSTDDAGSVALHRAWATNLARSGHDVYGEKLAPAVLSPSPAGDPRAVVEPPDIGLQGFFVVTAADEAEALAIARSLPHFRAGARVIVRRIEPT